MIRSPGDLAGLVRELGFLPFFRNGIAGFSVEERTPPGLWFAEDADGPWEWKGPAIRRGGCAYGRFFCGKAGFVSRDCYPDFANWRRGGYDLDARYEDGLARHSDLEVYEALAETGPALSCELRERCGYGKNRKGVFEGILTRLEMQGYVTAVGFEYRHDRLGHPYGWGIARLATPEAAFGKDFTGSVYRREPEKSRARVADHLARLFPGADPKEIKAIIG